MLTQEVAREAVEAHNGNQAAAARALGVPRSTLQWAYYGGRRKQAAMNPLFKKEQVKRPRSGTKRFIFSAAQGGAPVATTFLKNLEAYAAYLDAKIIISPFTYFNHSTRSATYDESIEPYLSSAQINIADKILFCGEININPTAVRPLSGFETYTRDKWGIFPHPRVELASVATAFKAPSKQIMTTGCVTLPKYQPRKAGIKAEFHHVIGALLVEVDKDGDVFARHLIADDNGNFQDLDHAVADEAVWIGETVEAITWGDIHAEQVDPVVSEACWGANGVVDVLAPVYQMFHDIGDFTARNHHSIRNPHHLFRMFRNKTDGVEDGIKSCANFLRYAHRPETTMVVVESNHDLALERWLREADYKTDPVNAVFFLECQREVYDAINRGEDSFSVFEWALQRLLPLTPFIYLREVDSFKICDKVGRGIECAVHGHRGANGAKGHLNAFAKMGSKANVAHTHCLPDGYKVHVEGRGWAPLKDVEVGDRVLGYSAASQHSVFADVFDTISGQYSGPMITFGRKSAGPLRQTVTAQHHLSLLDGSYIPVGEAIATRSIGDVPVSSLGVEGTADYEGVSDAELQQIVAVCADAYHASANTYRFHLRKQRKVERLSVLLGEAFTRVPSLKKDGAYDVCLSAGHQLTQRLRALIGPVKHLPNWFLKLSVRQAEVVLEELRHWDGTYEPHNAGRAWSTTKSGEAMIVSALASMAGYRLTCKEKSRHNGGYHISYSKQVVSLNSETHDAERLDQWQVNTTLVDAVDVFCLRTSTQNFWVMDPVTGQVSLTGNSAAIHEGIYQAGTSSKLDLGYNRGGLSSWNHAHIVTYPNGKRTIITMQGRKWRAD